MGERDPNDENTTAGKLVEAAGSVLLKPPLYDDALKPVVREVGQLLGTAGALANLVVRPLRTLQLGVNTFFDHVDAELKRRLEKKGQDARVAEAPSFVSGPALLGLAMVQDQPDLHHLFLNLLASAVLVERQPKVHPAYVEVIKQLAPAEARLLPFLKDEPSHAALFLREETGKRAYVDRGMLVSLGPFTPDQKELENLARLKIIDIEDQTELAAHDAYLDLEQQFQFLKDTTAADLQADGSRLARVRGFIQVTSFGEDFIQACVDDDWTW